MHIPLSGPDITQSEIDLINQVLRTPYLSMGPMIERFEGAMAHYVGPKHAVAVSSGTAGLHLCMRAAGIDAGDEVITTPFSFIASANCILFERATPVFADIDPKTLNIDADSIEERITRRTKALLPVHVFGQPCDMDKIIALAAKYDLPVIEDACEAMGAEYKGRKAGTFGRCAVLSFYPNKQMTTAEGGVILTDDEGWADLFRSLRNQGRGKDGSWLAHERLGYNYRLDELSSALGVAQLDRIEELLAKREKVAEKYNELLAKTDGVQIPYISPQVRMSWFLYVVRLAPGIDRARVMAELKEKGVASRPYFSPIHLQPFYRQMFGFKEGDFPITEAAARSTLALPFHSNLDEESIEYVCKVLNDTIAQGG
ncbi:MAG TPA: DegT/DnrJ/EryC1/StrS family aminotransferase [Anaerolineae bacterium]|nr:DegT/DnrJ/EryC1/StrS family aminotransferase [Anaerolineae bacterium]